MTTFTSAKDKPIKRILDGGGVTSPAAFFAFALGDPAGTVIVTTSYTGDVVLIPRFQEIFDGTRSRHHSPL